jgi:hypothetical protein
MPGHPCPLICWQQTAEVLTLRRPVVLRGGEPSPIPRAPAQCYPLQRCDGCADESHVLGSRTGRESAMRTGYVVALIALAGFGLISVFRALGALLAGGLNSYTMGQVTAGVVVAVLCFWGARKVLARLRAE